MEYNLLLALTGKSCEQLDDFRTVIDELNSFNSRRPYVGHEFDFDAQRKSDAIQVVKTNRPKPSWNGNTPAYNAETVVGSTNRSSVGSPLTPPRASFLRQKKPPNWRKDPNMSHATDFDLEFHNEGLVQETIISGIPDSVDSSNNSVENLSALKGEGKKPRVDTLILKHALIVNTKDEFRISSDSSDVQDNSENTSDGSDQTVKSPTRDIRPRSFAGLRDLASQHSPPSTDGSNLSAYVASVNGLASTGIFDGLNSLSRPFRPVVGGSILRPLRPSASTSSMVEDMINRNVWGEEEDKARARVFVEDFERRRHRSLDVKQRKKGGRRTSLSAMRSLTHRPLGDELEEILTMEVAPGDTPPLVAAAISRSQSASAAAVGIDFTPQQLEQLQKVAEELVCVASKANSQILGGIGDPGSLVSYSSFESSILGANHSHGLSHIATMFFIVNAVRHSKLGGGVKAIVTKHGKLFYDKFIAGWFNGPPKKATTEDLSDNDDTASVDSSPEIDWGWIEELNYSCI